MKIAIVLGATGGIGESVVHKLIKDGFTVIGTYVHSANKAIKLKAKYGDSFEIYQLDVSDESSISTFLNKINNKEINSFVNCSGINRDSFLFNLTEDNWNDVIEINLIGSIQINIGILKLMIKRKYGRIVNLSSVSGIYGRETQVNYSTSKGGIIGLTQLLGNYVGENEDIVCTTVAPGMIETEMVQGVSQRKLDLFLDACTAKQVGNVEHIADLVSFLVSDKNSYLQNTLINVDGGFMKC